MEKLAVVIAKRATAYENFKALAEKEDFDPKTDQQPLDDLKTEIETLDGQIKNVKDAQAMAVKTAQPVAGQHTVPATVENDPYIKDKSLVIGGIMKMLGAENGSVRNARALSTELYGESHPVTKALIVSSGPSGGFIVPPDYMAEIIPLLRAATVVRASGPRNIPMPRGTMTLPGQASAATASYGSETKAIPASQQTLRQIVATYKKLTALVPVSNDMMRYADPAVDAFVRDDLVSVIALREDAAFILGDGTSDTPRGFLSFAQSWVATNGGTPGSFSTTAASTPAVNGADPANSTGGNFITTTPTFTLATVANELGGAINRLDQANTPDTKRVWFMNPRSYNYLNNVQNTVGAYVYRDELSRGTLLGYPVRRTTQIPTNYINAASANSDCSFVFLVEMNEAMILDSMQLELAVSREGSYVDSVGTTVSAFQNDQTIIRCIAEHDFQMRHDQSISVIQLVRWAPAIA